MKPSDAGQAKEQIWVSVLIPVFNTEKYLREALNSMRDQTLKEIEIICVDDGSADSSPQILQEFADADPRFRIFKQENKGPSDARNWAVRESRGKYLYFMDSDDILEADALRQAVEFAERNALDLVCFDAEPFAEGRECRKELEHFRKSYLRKHDYPGVCTGAQMLARMQSHNDLVVAPWASMLKRELFIPNAMWYYPGIAHADVSYSFLAYLSARRAGYMKKVFFHRRVRPNSIMTGSKLSHHSWSYFCGCKLMLHRLRSFSLPQKDQASAARYIGTWMNMAQEFYMQMNEQERQDCIASVGIDAPLYRQIVALPAEAAEKHSRQGKLYNQLSAELRKVNARAGRIEQSLKGKPDFKNLYDTCVIPNTGADAVEIPKPVNQPEDRGISFENVHSLFRQILDLLSAMEIIPEQSAAYTQPLEQLSMLLQDTADKFTLLSGEEREKLFSLEESDRVLFAMLISGRANSARAGEAECAAAVACEKRLEERLTYLSELAKKGTAGHTRQDCEKQIEGFRRELRDAVAASKRTTVGTAPSGWRDAAAYLKEKYNPGRLAMLGYYRVHGIGLNGWQKELHRALEDWNTGEEYGAEVMVRYQKLLNSADAGIAGDRRKQVFAFRTASMISGADDYDYLAKGMSRMSAPQQKKTVTHVLLEYFQRIENFGAAEELLKAEIKPLPKDTVFDSVLTGEASGRTESLKVCTLRENGRASVLFASVEAAGKRQPERWIAAADPESGRIGSWKGFPGGAEAAPKRAGNVACWKKCAALCVKKHEQEPLGAELIVWDVRMLSGEPVIVHAGCDLSFVDTDVNGKSLRPVIERIIAGCEKNVISLSAPEQDGDAVSCRYEVSGRWAGGFPEKKEMSARYPGTDLSNVPEGILIIPFLAHILPAAWMCGAEVRVPVCDRSWAESLKQLMIAMGELFPGTAKDNLLKAERLTENPADFSGKCAVLCRNAVDAEYSAWRHNGEKPVLITVDEISAAQAASLPFPALCAEWTEMPDMETIGRIAGNVRWAKEFCPRFAQIGAAAVQAWRIGAKDMYTCQIDPAFDGNIRFGSAAVDYDGFGDTREDKQEWIAENCGKFQTDQK